MAWRDLLFDCSFRDVVFDVVGTRDPIGRAVSIAEFPFRDGGQTEDLGGRPARFSLQAVFFGADYDTRARLLLEALATAGTGELVHPVWGSIPRAQFVGGEVSHTAEEPDACRVSLEFVEDTPAAPFFAKLSCFQVQETVGAAGDLAVLASAEAVVGIVDPLRTNSPLAALDKLREVMVGPLLAFTAQAQGALASGLDVLSYPRAWAQDLATVSNGLLDIARFPGRQMAEWRAITDAFAAIGAQWGFGSASAAIANAYAWPAADPWSAGTAPSEAQAQNVVRVHLAVVNAAAQADAAALTLADEAAAPTLTPTEIETVVGSARTEIESAIAAARIAMPLEQARTITEPLKDLALALQDAGRALIELRPSLVRRSLEAPGNLRLIAHRWYGDHTRAPELWRLNNLRLPNFLQVGDVLNAYAQ